MLTLTSSYERLGDGEYLVRPMAPSYTGAVPDKTITLSGRWVPIWEWVTSITPLAHDDQQTALSQVPDDARPQLVSAISLLREARVVDFDLGREDIACSSGSSARLRKLHLELTNRCNFKCKACYLGRELLPSIAPQSREGTTAQWVKVAHEAGKLGCAFATVTGGEPFLRADIMTILRALSENGIISAVNTNASCITPKIAAELRSILLTSIAVTLYGWDMETAEAYTENRGGFAAAVAGIRRLVDYRVPVSVKFFATRYNEQGFETVKALLAPIPVVMIGHTIHGDLFEGAPPDSAVLPITLTKTKRVQETQLPCHPTGRGLGIQPDGTVRACPKLTVFMGNVFEEGLEHIWTRTSDVAAFRAFWVDYCKEEGFVPGDDRLCPAAFMLNKPNGLTDFRARWDTWRASWKSTGTGLPS